MTDLPTLPEMSMPPAERAAVEAAYRRATSILEYGSGGSTVFAARHATAPLVSIESDAAWAENLREALAAHGLMREGIDIRHANIGPTKEWGMPRSHNEWRRYWALPLAVWQGEDAPAPDVVLIDGRFRLGCFAATLIHTTRPVTVLWDDYEGRGSYAVAEAFAPVAERIGRMARFDLAPRTLSNADMSRLIPFFFSSR